MAKAKNGDTVKIHYTGKLKDGTVFDSSIGHDPLEFQIGQNQIFPKLEEAVIGMEPSDTKTVIISSEDAYGPYREEMVVDVPKNSFPADITPEVGLELELVQSNNQPIIVTILKVADDTVTLDANHPLAGKDLTFDVELVEIV